MITDWGASLERLARLLGGVRTVSLIYAVWAVLADGVVLRLLLLNG